MMILPMFLPSGGGSGFDNPKWKRIAVVGVVWAVLVVVLHFTVAERIPFVHANILQAQHPIWLLAMCVCAVPLFVAAVAGFVALMGWLFD